MDNVKGPNRELMVDNMINKIHTSCPRSLKHHFLHNHWVFPESLGDVIEEQGEQLHHGIQEIEKW